ncbi:unnamed protein product [Protopolystoma xenopodis]|uniref:Uncharacterized protein n=1 Tax=Protopolystoma xenopodis TaxID=117903 RepID=A0A448XNJ1_9PLAT|nr:unnamed protein product [Protopolystoma xenopodis]
MRDNSPCSPLRLDQLKRLCEHKYSCSGVSLSEPILQKFWNTIVVYIPSCLAPNTLTLVGLITNILGTVALVICSQDAKSEVPSLALIFAAVNVFVYQTLDALDGKHARRTNSSSPLGELFDHGCDSISMLFVPISAFIAFGMGEYPILMFIEFFCLVSLFYIAHWQAYVTGSLHFGIIDVTEGEIICIIIFILTSIMGVSTWGVSLPIISMNFRVLQFLIVICFWAANFISFSNTVLEGGTGKYGTTVAVSLMFSINI